MIYHARTRRSIKYSSQSFFRRFKKGRCFFDITLFRGDSHRIFKSRFLLRLSDCFVVIFYLNFLMKEMEDLYIIDMDYFSFPSRFRYFVQIPSDLFGGKYRAFMFHPHSIWNRSLNMFIHYLFHRPTIILICCLYFIRVTAGSFVSVCNSHILRL